MVYRLFDGSDSKDYKIGDLFIVKDALDSNLAEGSLVKITQHNHSELAVVKVIIGSCNGPRVRTDENVHLYWWRLQPLNSGEDSHD